MIKKFSKILFDRVTQYSSKIWFSPLFGLIAMVDVFLVVAPTDAIFMAVLLLNGKIWWHLAFFTSLGSSLGTFIFGWLLKTHGIELIAKFSPGLMQSANWISVSGWVHEHGLIAIFLLGISPLTQVIGVGSYVLAGGSMEAAFTAQILGRMTKYTTLGLIARYSPSLLSKIFKQKI